MATITLENVPTSVLDLFGSTVDYTKTDMIRLLEAKYYDPSTETYGPFHDPLTASIFLNRRRIWR